MNTRDTADWLAVLQPADIWCSEVLTWPEMRATKAYGMLDLEQTITRNGHVRLETLRAPIRINGATLKSPRAAPELGQDTARVLASHLPQDAAP